MAKIRTVTDAARRLINLTTQIAPLAEELDTLKKWIRPHQGEHVVPGIGTVTVGQPGTTRADGLQVVFDETAYTALPDELKAKLTKLGVVKIETKWVKATAAKVTIMPGKFPEVLAA